MMGWLPLASPLALLGCGFVVGGIVGLVFGLAIAIGLSGPAADDWQQELEE